jgi:hypothetical protein
MYTGAGGASADAALVFALLLEALEAPDDPDDPEALEALDDPVDPEAPDVPDDPEAPEDPADPVDPLPAKVKFSTVFLVSLGRLFSIKKYTEITMIKKRNTPRDIVNVSVLNTIGVLLQQRILLCVELGTNSHCLNLLEQ